MAKTAPEAAPEVTPPEPPPFVLTDKDKHAVLSLRKAAFDALGTLSPGHPARGALAEALLIYQLNAPAELKP